MSQAGGAAVDPGPEPPAPAPAPVDSRRPGPPSARVAWAVAAAAVAVGAGVRWWQLSGRGQMVWNDSADFLAGSQAPWWSGDLWAGPRPPATMVLLKLVGGGHGAFVAAQAAIAVMCWAALAAALAGMVAATVAGRAGPWLAGAAVLGFSVTSPVTMWDSSVLSESLAISLLALVVAAALPLARQPSGRRAAVLLASLAAWSATRDSHAAVTLVGGAAALAAVGLAWWRSGRRSRPLALLGAGALVLGVVALVTSSHGERGALPMRNVYGVRVLPYPDRVAWFADHGMPQAEVFAGPAARSPHVERGMPPVVYVDEKDPELGPWLKWVEADGRAAFAAYVATHPHYLVTEPLRSPERAFNNARGDRGFYRAPDMPQVPLVDPVLAPPTPVVLMAAAFVAAWAAVGARWTPVLATGAVAAALALPHGLVAWHSDGMETARHLAVPALQLRVGALLLVVGGLAAAWGSGHRSGSPSSRLGRSRPPSASTTAPVT